MAVAVSSGHHCCFIQPLKSNQVALIADAFRHTRSQVAESRPDYKARLPQSLTRVGPRKFRGVP